MEISFLGATRTVTGSAYMVSSGKYRVMVDCGLYQGLPSLKELNYTHPNVVWPDIDAILLTHAHIDHSGLIPRAVKLGFNGPIYTHPATYDLAEIMLRDSAEVHEEDAKWLTRKRLRAGKPSVEPLFNINDVEASLKMFQRVEYEDLFDVVPGFKAELRDAGHILGAASIRVTVEEDNLKRQIVFSGDIGNHQAPILKEPFGFDRADAVLIESTYGNRLHETPDDRHAKLKQIINEAWKKRGKVLIPSFAVGRTQEILYILSEMLYKNEIPQITIFLDSPMAISATSVHENHPECFDSATMDRIRKGENPFHPATLRTTRTVSESRKINEFEGPAVIIAGGGMCEGGRIVHHLKHNLYDPNNHLLIVGYQAEGTLGRLILNGVKRLRLFGEEVAVNAKVTPIGAFSAHADRKGLTDWLKYFETPPEIVFIVHGEEKAGLEFAETVRQELGFNTYQPKLGQIADLSNLGEVTTGKRRYVDPTVPAAQDVKEIIARVSMLGEEFQSTIQKYAMELTSRIKEAKDSGREPQWRTEDVNEVLMHLSEVVDGDLDTLENISKSGGQ
ncbi:MAG: MBL fold metallo-hydrolase [bacterium]|nr:MBL fold metallo-hydrolase [bacterium]